MSYSILFLTKYQRKGASSRYRLLQYIPYIEKAGFQCEISPLFNDDYLLYFYQQGRGHGLDVLNAFLRRACALLNAYRFDLIIIEKEILPYFPILPERLLSLLGISYIVDYDDPLFHQYDCHQNRLVRIILGEKISSIMHKANLVIAGNSYIADYAKRAGASQIDIIPTVVNLENYPTPIWNKNIDRPFTIGWIGSPSTSKYLKIIAPALTEVCAKNNACVLLIGSQDLNLQSFPIEYVQWNEITEIEFLNKMDVGIMPLQDELWEQGKCGLKLIQYMACGKPVIASPVGVNTEIIKHGINGYLATDHNSWVKALDTLRDNPDLRQKMGKNGRTLVEQKYSLQVTAPRIVQLIKSVVEQ